MVQIFFKLALSIESIMDEFPASRTAEANVLNERWTSIDQRMLSASNPLISGKHRNPLGLQYSHQFHATAQLLLNL